MSTSKNLMNNIDMQCVTSTLNSIFVPKVYTETYGKNSIKYQSTKLWNHLQQTLKVDLKQQSRAEAKKIISEHFYNNY